MSQETKMWPFSSVLSEMLINLADEAVVSKGNMEGIRDFTQSLIQKVTLI